MSIKIPLWARIVLGLLIIATLIYVLNPIQIFDTLLTVNPWYLILAFFVYAMTFFILSYRWQKILKDMGIHIRLIEAYPAFVGGVLISDVTPGRIGEFTRPLLIRNYGDNNKCFLSVILDRSIDLATIIILGIVGFLIIGSGKWDRYLWILIIPLTALTICYILWHKRELLQKKIGTIGIPLLSELIENLSNAYMSVLLPKKMILRSLMLTIIAWGGHALRVIIIAASLRCSLQVFPLFFILPLISVLSIVPLTISGLGLVEGTLAFFLSDMGVAPSTALAVALLDRGVTVAFHLFAGIPSVKKICEL